MMPRYGRPPQSGKRYIRRPGAYAILPMQRGLLVTHQSHPHPEFQLPGGGIDAGEHIGPALRREVLEETGWIIGKIRHFGAFKRFVFMPEYDLWAEKICSIYIANPVRAIGPPLEEGHGAHVLTLEHAFEAIENPGDRAALHRAANAGLLR